MNKEEIDFQLLSRFIYSLDKIVYNKIRSSLDDAECRRVLLEHIQYILK